MEKYAMRFCRIVIYIAVFAVGYIYIDIVRIEGLTLDTVLLTGIVIFIFIFLIGITHDETIDRVKDKIENM